MKQGNEPSLEEIDDYNNNESKEKRKTVYWIIAGLIVAGIIYSVLGGDYGVPDDYVGSAENPGIDTSRR
jgi:hypothetical protein